MEYESTTDSAEHQIKDFTERITNSTGKFKDANRNIETHLNSYLLTYRNIINLQTKKSSKQNAQNEGCDTIQASNLSDQEVNLYTEISATIAALDKAYSDNIDKNNGIQNAIITTAKQKEILLLLLTSIQESVSKIKRSTDIKKDQLNGFVNRINQIENYQKELDKVGILHQRVFDLIKAYKTHLGTYGPLKITEEQPCSELIKAIRDITETLYPYTYEPDNISVVMTEISSFIELLINNHILEIQPIVKMLDKKIQQANSVLDKHIEFSGAEPAVVAAPPTARTGASAQSCMNCVLL